MMPKDWLEYMRDAERNIKKVPDPLRAHRPKITRMQSSRMRTVSGQSNNPIKSIFTPESKWNATPTMPEEWVGTKEVGPGDVNNSATQWRTGNMTTEPSINGNKTDYRPRSHSHGPEKGLDELMKEYGV